MAFDGMFRPANIENSDYLVRVQSVPLVNIHACYYIFGSTKVFRLDESFSCTKINQIMIFLPYKTPIEVITVQLFS